MVVVGNERLLNVDGDRRVCTRLRRAGGEALPQAREERLLEVVRYCRLGMDLGIRPRLLAEVDGDSGHHSYGEELLCLGGYVLYARGCGDYHQRQH